MAAQGAGFTVLPQYQGNLYDIQTKQALAQALMQKGLTGSPELYRPQGGGYQYVPQVGIGGLLAQALQGYVGGELQQQANQGMTQLGQQQWNSLLGAMGGGTPASAAATQGGESPGTAAGGSYSVGAVDPQRAALASALAPQSAGSSPLNPSGLPPQLAVQAYMTDPAAYFKEFVAPNYKPTESTLAGRQAGFTPTQIQAANAGRIAQQNYIAPVAGGPGQVYRDPITKQIVAQNPNIGEGMQPVYDQEGRFVGTMPINNYTNTVQAIEGAKATGRAAGEVQQVFNPQTQQMEIVPRSSVLGGGQSGGLGSGRFGGGGSGGVAAAPPLGVPEAASVEGKQQAEQGFKTQNEAGAAPQQRLFIRELRQTMEGFTPGNPNADWALMAKKMVNTANPFGNLFDPGKIASQEQFNKAANQLAMQQFKDLGSGGAQGTLETAMKSNPNATISRLGNKGILDLLQGNVDAKERMGQEWQKWKEAPGNGPGSYSKFQTEWNKSFDPQVFMIPYQSKQEAAAMVNAMTPNERKVFQQKFNFAVKNGWIQLPE